MSNKFIDELYKNKFEIKDDFIDVSKSSLIEFYKISIRLLFLEFYKKSYQKEDLEALLESAKKELYNAFGDRYLVLKKTFDEIISSLFSIKELLILDIKAIFEGDPAATSYSEIIQTYPGFLAVSAFRVAHEFYIRDLKNEARIISEYAHSRTGIDISAGATIGKSFFIDHGTGIVIGETTIIGNNCKIYQGVTLGALSLKDGRKLTGVKRHPTIEDNVTIYSGASIFGGNTIIGANSIIGSNVEIKESVKPNSKITCSCFSVCS